MSLPRRGPREPPDRCWLETLGRWDDRRFVHEGGLAEQLIGQHLLFRNRGLEQPFLCYWLREGKSNNAEVDFVVDHRRRIVPVEVKAGKAGSMRWVHHFLARDFAGKADLTVRFDLNPPSISDHENRLRDGRSVHFRLLPLPLHLVGQTVRLLEAV